MDCWMDVRDHQIHTWPLLCSVLVSKFNHLICYTSPTMTPFCPLPPHLLQCLYASRHFQR